MGEFIVADTGDDILADDLLHNPHGTDTGYEFADGSVSESIEPTGWYFGSGNPEFWHFADQLVVPGGKVLDIGMEYGRSSFYFATKGMQVLGLDTNPRTIGMVNEMVARFKDSLDLDITATLADATKEELGTAVFDVVLLDYTLYHFPSKSHALALVDKAYQAVKPGGHIWVRAMGKEDSSYERLREQSSRDYNTTIVDDDVITHPCVCSGEYSIDPGMYFGQTDLLQHFSWHGARIVHSQLMPEIGRRNIMYGEDFNRDMPVDVSGAITLLAQKP